MPEGRGEDDEEEADGEDLGVGLLVVRVPGGGYEGGREGRGDVRRRGR